MTKSLLIALTLFSASAMALGPVNPLDRTVVKSEQFKGVSYMLEQKLGRKLTVQESEGLAAAAEKESSPQAIQVNGPLERDTKESLFCVEAGYAVGGQIYRAACVSFWRWQTYDMAILGLGAGLEIKASLMHLTFKYAQSEFKNNRDPIPGNYGLVSMSGSLGLGLTFIGGDSGNKSISATGVNLGIGGDLGSGAFLAIQ